MLIAAAVCFLLHALVALIDGAYFHLYKYKLYTRPDSVTEHLSHTLRAGLMSIGAFVFFVVNSGGWLLWAGCALIAVDVSVETWDVLIERKSRASLGGLSSAEYLSHAHAILLYTAAYALVLAAKPTGAFSLGSALTLDPYPAPVRWLGWAVGIGSALSTVQHVWYLRPAYRVQ